MGTFERLMAVVENLKLHIESAHFIIHYDLRNPISGKGLGIRGVHDRSLIICYLDALECLYTAMVNSPLSRKSPFVGNKGKTLVCVFNIPDVFRDGFPFMIADKEEVPLIGLPGRSYAPTIYAERQEAAAAAVHEATHVFNALERPMMDPNSGPWEWFDEATAVFMENLVLAGNPDNLQYAANWCDMPEVPLDDWPSRYQMYPFLRYLAKKIGLGFTSEVWMNSELRETPLDALTRLFGEKGHTFCSYDPNVRDIFASGYCMDSYFLFDHNSPGFALDVYARYGERAITESFVLKAGESGTCSDSLDHLACRYYRFYLKDGVTRLRVQVQGAFRTLKAEVTTVTKEMQQGTTVEPLRPMASPGPEGTTILSAELAQLDPERLDHLVLVVSNCGLRKTQKNRNIPHDDGQVYTVEVTAL